jgi:hypothetical protein
MSYTVDGDRGVAITVPKKNNVVRVKAEVAQGGRLVDRSLNEVSLRADQVKVQKDDGATTVRFDSALGNVIAGGSGVEGDVIAVDANGDLMVVLDGGQPEVVVGGPQHPGAVRVLDGNQTDEVKLDGAAGDVWFRGALRNLANPAQGPITHALLQSLFPLTGGGLTSLHRHLPVGDATTARVVFIRMPAFSTAPFTVPVFVTGPIVACIMLARYGAGSLGGAAVADISDIDGSLPPFGASAAGFFGGSIFAGTVTTSVTLRLASSFFAAAFAVGLVFTK